MNDVAPMGMGQRTGDLGAVSHHRLVWQPFTADGDVQGLALDQFHYDVELTAGFADFVHRADIRMGKGGSRARLPQQQLPRFPGKRFTEEF